MILNKKGCNDDSGRSWSAADTTDFDTNGSLDGPSALNHFESPLRTPGAHMAFSEETLIPG